MSRCLFLLLLCVSADVQAATSETQWYSVLLDGRKIGQFESTREVRDTRVITRQSMHIQIERAGTRMELGSSETSEETLDGKPLAFDNTSRMSGSETRIVGLVDGRRVAVRTHNAGAWSERTIDWPRGALLPEGLRLAMLDIPLEPGARFRALSFQPASSDAIEVTATVGERESVSLPGGRQKLTRIDQSFAFPGAALRSTAWVDDAREVRRLAMAVLGVEMIMVECDKACATAPNQSSDVFSRTLVPSPRALGRKDLDGTIRYTFVPRDRGAALRLADTGEQRVSAQGKGVSVDVRREAETGFGTPPEAGDFTANDWLQSDAPEVSALAQRALGEIGDAPSEDARMRGLERFVRGFISSKTLGVGYASALEIVRKPEGDCTEHAVLLAALGRSLGIATRVVDGLAYAPEFAGERQVFVPHAWVQAWTDGAWRSYDAALAGFDAGHVAFSAGDGDPWRFYQSLELLGRMELKRVQPLSVPRGP